MKEKILKKYFVHYMIPTNIGTKYINSAGDLKELEKALKPSGDTPRITGLDELIERDGSTFYVCCNKGHMISTDFESMDDLIENGCPFCKNHYHYDWQRHIDYSGDFEDVYTVARFLPRTFGRLKKKEFHTDFTIDNKIKTFHQMTNINGLCNKYETNIGSFDKNNWASYELWDAWAKVLSGKLRDDNLIAYINDNKLLESYKPKEKDFFITKCSKCDEIVLYSAIHRNYEDIKCRCCGEIIAKQKKYFDFTFDKFEPRYKKYSSEKFICVNPEYGKTLEDIKRLLESAGDENDSGS